MTQRTNGMPKLKYSEETFRDMYEALKNAYCFLNGENQTLARKALAKAEGK